MSHSDVCAGVCAWAKPMNATAAGGVHGARFTWFRWSRGDIPYRSYWRHHAPERLVHWSADHF